MKSIIFDLDDTLYIDKNLRNKREEAIRNFLKQNLNEYLKLKETKHGTIESFIKLGYSKHEFYEAISAVVIDIKKDQKLIEILSKLKRDYELVVLSNSPSWAVKDILIKLGIKDLFDKVYSGDESKYEKPSQESFFMVKEGDICIGNNFKKDLYIPKTKGAKTILVSQFLEGEPDHHIKTIYEIEDLFV